MRILPLSIQLIHKKNLNSNKVSNPVANYGLPKDTVSFSGSYIHEAYSDLNNTINNKILPLVNDSKPLYQSLIDINNDANKIMNKFSEHEIDFISQKGKMADLSVSSDNKYYEPYISRYNKYKRNLTQYATLKNIVKDENYNKQEIKEALKNAENLLFENNQELNKIKPLAKEYEAATANITLYNEGRTLKNSQLPLKDKLTDTNETRFKAAAYALLIPLPETFIMLRSFKNIEKELQKPTQSPMKTQTTIEHLQQSAESIIQNFDRYKEYKPEITNFIEKHSKNQISKPSDKEINEAYVYLTGECEKNATKERNGLYGYYKTMYLDKGVKVNFEALDQYLNDCETAVNTLYNKKKQIDEKIIEENNRKFFEQYGR